MACFHPILGYKLQNEVTENGKAKIIFDKKAVGNRSYLKIQVPCGRCIGCRIDKSREWALRCVNEADLHPRNCFITLTYNNESLPKDQSLSKRHFQLFIKRLRKHHGLTKDRINNDKAYSTDDGKIRYPIRYFMCGEYGDQLTRPHYHACLFNIAFDDQVIWYSRDGVKLYRSEQLEKLWAVRIPKDQEKNHLLLDESLYFKEADRWYQRLGFCTIGEVTFKSAAYIARYCTKKITGPKAKEHYRRVDIETGEIYQLTPEYVGMSRRPGIGSAWLKKYQADLYPKDYTTHHGVKFKAPAFYDRLLEKLDADLHQQIKDRRTKNALLEDHDDLVRLSAREKVIKAQTSKLERTFK